MVGSVRRRMLSTAVAKAVVLPFSAGSALLCAYLIVRDVGPQQFGAITVVTTLILLIPFADLGLSAPVVNAFAARAADRYSTLQTAWSLLWLVAIALVSLVLAVQVTSGWGWITGSRFAGGLITMSLIVFVLAVPFGVGLRVLTGTGEVALATGLQGAYPFVTVALTAAGYVGGWPDLYIVAPSCAHLCSAVLMFAVARRRSGWPVGQLKIRLTSRAQVLRVLSGGLPMLVISAGIAFAFQTDRIILQQFSSPEELADYAIVMTLYAPAWALIASMGLQLWSHFGALRSSLEGGLSREFLKRWRDLAILGSLGALALVTIGPVVTDQLYGVSVPRSLWLCVGGLLLAQSLHLPSGMYLTDGRGLQYQAATVVCMCAVSVGLSVLLAPGLGAQGPVLGSLVSVVSFQLIPCLGFVLVDLRNRDRPTANVDVTQEAQP